jgi:hypothetical protein
VYTPGGQVGEATGEHFQGQPKEKKKAQGKRETVIRKAGGKVWEDQTLLEWDPGESSCLRAWAQMKNDTYTPPGRPLVHDI